MARGAEMDERTHKLGRHDLLMDETGVVEFWDESISRLINIGQVHLGTRKDQM
jgi:hypothetical protein